MSTLKSDSIQPTATGNSLVLKTGVGDVERMRIDTAGLVGIGTQVPLAPLHVSALAAEVRITAPTINGADWGILPQTGNTTPVFRIYDRSNSLDRLTISSAGLVTIPVALQVTGNAGSSAAPTVGTHLCNKTYVDDPVRIGSVFSFILPSGGYATTAVTTAMNSGYVMPPGWIVTSPYATSANITWTVPANSGAWVGWWTAMNNTNTYGNITWANSGSTQTITVPASVFNNLPFFITVRRVS